MPLPRLRRLLRPTVAQRSPAPSGQSSRPPVEADDSWGGFPPARYFAILGELPENYRGTATVALHRSCMIAAQTGRPLEILTLGHTVDYEALTREMRSDGRLTDLVRFRNMWTDLATMHPEHTRPSKGAFEAFTPLDEASTSETPVRASRCAASARTPRARTSRSTSAGPMAPSSSPTGATPSPRRRAATARSSSATPPAGPCASSARSTRCAGTGSTRSWATTPR